MITAEQVVAALTGGLVSNAVNIPTVRGEDLAALEPYLPLATQLGRLATSLAERTSVDRIEAAYYGHLADFDTRLLTLSVLNGALSGPDRGERQPRQRGRRSPRSAASA